MSASKNPALNLKAVLQETGIAADTLRAWERRYGLPLPQRTAGGHRLYSQYDVETIKWLIARQAEGLSISRAVDLWNEHHTSGNDPLGGLNPQIIQPQSNPLALIDANIQTLCTQWLSACLDFNEQEAEHILNQAFAMYPVEKVCVELLQQGLSTIGVLWYENKASVQQEHFASGLAIRKLHTLISASSPPTRKETIIVGSPARERHTFTALLISLFLRRRGFNIVYLGSNVPEQHFEETIKAVNASLVLLIAHQLITAATLKQTAQVLAAKKIRVGFGGRIFTIQPSLINLISGHYLGNTVEEALNGIEVLIKNPASKVKRGRNEEYQKAAHIFQDSRSQIEASLNQKVYTLGYESEHIHLATEFLGDNIHAALQLGDIELVNNEMEWVSNLLHAYHIPEKSLHEYMKLYSKAVNSNMKVSNNPIMKWLEQYK